MICFESEERPNTVPIQPEQRLSPEVSNAMRSAALSLKAGAPAHAAAIAQRIHDRMPEFGPDAQVTQQTVDTITAIITGFARMVLRGETPEDIVVPAEPLEYARSFVHRGLDRHLLVREYRLGHEELLRVSEDIIADQSLEGEALATVREALSAAQFGYEDVLGSRVLEEYESERARWARSSEKLRHETVTAILAGQPVDAQHAGGVLRYPLELAHVAIVLWNDASDDGLVAEDRLRATARELASRAGCQSSLVMPASALVTWAWLGFRAAPDEQRMAALLEPRADCISLAVGEPADGIAGFRSSHAEALGARRIAKLSKSRAGTVTRWGNVAIVGLLSADAERARQFVTRELGPVDADNDAMARLRATLAIYFREGDVIAATAQRLGVHINTISYRLRQCEELLERPVKQRRFELEAALLLRDRIGLSLAVTPPGES
jgi:DNA-binding PucR family transcriptional regulator